MPEPLTDAELDAIRLGASTDHLPWLRGWVRTLVDYVQHLQGEVERLRADAKTAREQRAAALREAADAALNHYGTWGGAGWADWLRERADRIEAE